jgi:hypothetical protein
VCVLHRLDAAATAVVPGGGYDPDFRAPLPVNTGGGTGSPSRREKAAVSLRCQLDRTSWGDDIMSRSGHETLADIQIALHRPELEALGLLTADGVPAIYPGDRIDRIETLDGQLVERFPVPPGMYVYKIERAGFGLRVFGAPRFNLVILYCAPERKVGMG